MNTNVERLMLIFLGVFVLSIGGVATYWFGWEVPKRQCESAHKWWDGGQRVCATPVLISDITGRTIQDKDAEAKARAAVGRAPAK